ncbi:MAG: peptide deformylase [Thermomicrobiales bacterium]|nr:peptide deformylase [Thermomicrobiales bacterium]MCO5221272.1 peptide deformylase [Thermomicrobiales bacterium]
MARLEIVLEGDPRLRQKATRIKHADESLRKIAADMHETMDAAPGVGLAGPQVGLMRRIVVVHVPKDEEEEQEEVRLTLIDPEIVKSQGKVYGQEGCLSIPRWVGEVPRAETITVKAIDLDNKHIRLKARGYLARVIQHEVDHLDGILFVDRVEDRSTLFQVTEDELSKDEYAVDGEE